MFLPQSKALMHVGERVRPAQVPIHKTRVAISSVSRSTSQESKFETRNLGDSAGCCTLYVPLKLPYLIRKIRKSCILVRGFWGVDHYQAAIGNRLPTRCFL